MATKKYASIAAITELWAKVKALVPTKTSDLTNDSGYITDAGVTSFNGNSGAITYTAPVTSVNGNTGAVTVVEDDKTWNGVTLNQSYASNNNDYYVTAIVSGSASGTTARLALATKTPTANAIPKYDAYKYLSSTTPSANDNSTKVATTAYVDGAIPTAVSSLTNDAGYLTLATLPIYNGSYSQVNS